MILQWLIAGQAPNLTLLWIAIGCVVASFYIAWDAGRKIADADEAIQNGLKAIEQRDEVAQQLAILVAVVRQSGVTCHDCYASLARGDFGLAADPDPPRSPADVHFVCGPCWHKKHVASDKNTVDVVWHPPIHDDTI